MSEMNRREALTLIALAPFAPAAARAQEVTAASETASSDPRPAQAPLYFTVAEMALVAVLADLILPADERSGSATEAGVPAFIDFMMTDTRDRALPVHIRGGLAWVDAESRRRFGHGFVEAAEGERTEILDDIAWPARARPEMSHGVAFFNRFRDLVASGFWSSEMGIADLGYIGNTAVVRWEGCSPAALRKLGLGTEA
jgi:gluconate 2-dehydrogenase gamma chain